MRAGVSGFRAAAGGWSHLEWVLGEVALLRGVLFEVEADGGADDARARDAEDDAAAVGEDEADTLVACPVSPG